jgi:hypothetical protein
MYCIGFRGDVGPAKHWRSLCGIRRSSGTVSSHQRSSLYPRASLPYGPIRAAPGTCLCGWHRRRQSCPGRCAIADNELERRRYYSDGVVWRHHRLKGDHLVFDDHLLGTHDHICSFCHSAARPLPRHSTLPSSRSWPNTRRMVARLTVGQARSRSAMAKVWPGSKVSMASCTARLLAPGALSNSPTNLDGVPDGYRAMDERKAIKVLIELYF